MTLHRLLNLSVMNLSSHHKIGTIILSLRVVMKVKRDKIGITFTVCIIDTQERVAPWWLWLFCSH